MPWKYNPFTNRLDYYEVASITPGTYVQTLTGNSGGAVSSDGSGNINTIGGNNISVVGNPGTNTLTASVTGTTNFAVQIGNASGSLTSVALGSSGQVLTSNGAGVAPTFQTNANGDVVGPASAIDNALARFDGTTGKLIQNGVTIETDAGELLAGDGSQSNPSYSFVNDPDTGMYVEGANTLKWTTGGSNRLILGASGILTNFGGIVISFGNFTFNEGFIGVSRSVAGNITGATNDYILIVTSTAAPRTVTIPNISNSNQIYMIKDGSGGAGTNNITVTTPGGTVLIDGATSQVINVNYGSMQVVFDGTNYFIVG